MEYESIQLGNYGKMTAEGIAFISIKDWRPEFYRVIGLEKTGVMKMQKLSPGYKESFLNDLRSGLYYFGAKAYTTEESRPCYILLNIENRTVKKLMTMEEAMDYVKLFYPGDYEDAILFEKEQQRIKEIVARLADEINNERREFKNIVIDEITATPEFENFNSNTIETKLKNGTDEEVIIQSFIVPSRYIVQSPVFAKGKTGEDAIKQAKDIIQKRESEREFAVKAASEAGFPELTGTPRQIAWAVAIRAKFAEANPGHPMLKRATTAKYWIENHRGA